MNLLDQGPKIIHLTLYVFKSICYINMILNTDETSLYTTLSKNSFKELIIFLISIAMSWLYLFKRAIVQSSANVNTKIYWNKCKLIEILAKSHKHMWVSWLRIANNLIWNNRADFFGIRNLRTVLKNSKILGSKMRAKWNKKFYQAVWVQFVQK